MFTYDKVLSGLKEVSAPRKSQVGQRMAKIASDRRAPDIDHTFHFAIMHSTLLVWIGPSFVHGSATCACMRAFV
jgi:hypothetical protein